MWPPFWYYLLQKTLDVVTLREKNKDSEFFISRLMEKEAESVYDVEVPCWINLKASDVLCIFYKGEMGVTGHLPPGARFLG